MPTHRATAEIPILSAGVDWLTMTSRGVAQSNGLHALGVEIMDWERAGGNDMKTAGTQGYRGWGAGGAMVGEREDGWLLRLSGATAARWYRRALDVGGHVTRLDVQVTAHGGEYCTDLVFVHREEARHAARGRGRPFGIRVDVADKGGQTLYLGRRQSEVYERCYDKHSEDPGAYPPGSWRYEVELKGAAAGAAAGALHDQARPGAVSVGLVHSHFNRRGVHPIFAPDIEYDPPLAHRLESSRERRERWLREHVSLTFARVVEESGWDVAFDAISRAMRPGGLVKSTRRAKGTAT